MEGKSCILRKEDRLRLILEFSLNIRIARRKTHFYILKKRIKDHNNGSFTLPKLDSLKLEYLTISTLLSISA